MNIKNLQTRQMFALINREFQEYRNVFVYMPFAFALLMVAASTWGLYRMQQTGTGLIAMNASQAQPAQEGDEITGFAVSAFNRSLSLLSDMPLEFREMIVNTALNGLAPGLFIAYWGSLLFYYMLALYQQRKDRSILFWNSMPVSDAQTVISKILAGLFILPMVYLLALLLMQLLQLVVISAFGLAAGLGANIIEAFWVPAQPITNIFTTLVLTPIAALWCLPVYGALLLGSAWARNAPFAWVAGVPVIVITTEFVTNDSFEILGLLVRHSIPFWLYGGEGVRSISSILNEVMNLELLISALLGGLFVIAAIKLNRSEDF